MFEKQSCSHVTGIELHPELTKMPVDRMQWGAEPWQFADLHMPDEPSPFQNDHGVPCIMLIHGGFWKKEYTLELMQPIANALSDAGVAAWNIEFKRWENGDEGVWMDTISDVLRAWGQLALLPGIDITRSMVMGHSAGGHLALLMASKAERKPWLAIAQAPITDLFGADDSKLSDDGDATYARIMEAKGSHVQKVWLPGDHYSIIDAASDDWLVQQDTILDWL